MNAKLIFFLSILSMVLMVLTVNLIPLQWRMDYIKAGLLLVATFFVSGGSFTRKKGYNKFGIIFIFMGVLFVSLYILSYVSPKLAISIMQLFDSVKK
jgi:hypothetical protein